MSLMGGAEEFIGYQWEPAEYNILSYVGDTFKLRIRLREKTTSGLPGDYVNFTDDPCTFLSQVRDSPDRDSGLIKTLNVANGDQDGEIVLSLPNADVQAIINGFWDFQVTWTETDDVVTYLAGTFDISPKDVSHL